MNNNYPYAKQQMDLLMDLFSGADGGVGFVNLRTVMEHVKDKDDPASVELRTIFVTFARLCRNIMEFKHKENQ